MQGLSEHQQLIREVFLIMVYHHNEATEEILNGIMKLPSIPSFGVILFLGKPSLQFIWETFCADKAEVAKILQELLSHQYLSLRTTPTTHDNYDLAKLFDMRDKDFKQAVRTTKDGFLWLLDQICQHPIFYSNSPWPQLPIPHQLALTLKRLGSNGNSALVKINKLRYQK
ncbi:uncharacterized protein PGTG_11246 [Puccinia graminis f. sp. tritici CRL 75-36-700-3]|uniref:Uncharacterized protein n=1 Tax=Puccinia graminis f. sp. tritici (strain CRL 75-36-700-3 / race SCCL) TaxID=418459 RepID=E3KLA2_PUCGT|nr:uncharacterized protein PGTG_11246 [Puccinia graminis f. sp. tritici CRL 75-36-700-3]EFP85077.2 hypothetical protein PGTG_11246 [Puccinia graminis f. sp. tritici CRL 75-36-700-3]